MVAVGGWSWALVAGSLYPSSDLERLYLRESISLAVLAAPVRCSAPELGNKAGRPSNRRPRAYLH